MTATWIPGVLRDAGLQVVEVPGWESRGGNFAPKGVMIHHTATGPSWSTDRLTGLLVKGRVDLRGPLCNLQLDRDGTFRVIAAGRANHAGAGSWPGITQGNTQTIGIEAANDGRGESWPAAQREAMALGSAALLRHLRASEAMLVGHKEWAPKRKIDPAGIDMDLLRKVVRGAIHGNPRPTVVQEGFDVSKLAMVKRGSRGDNVARVQGLLLAAEVLNVSENVRSDKLDGIFGPSTERSVRSFQSKSGLVPDGIVGERTWSALLGV